MMKHSRSLCFSVHDDEVSVPDSDQDNEGAERPRNFSLIKRYLAV